MSDTSPLFTKTSNVLRDITIIELQKNNETHKTESKTRHTQIEKLLSTPK